MAGLWDRLFSSDDAEEQEEQADPRFHDFDEDNPWGKQPEPEPREKTDTGDTLFHEFNQDDPFGKIYYPLDDDGKIFNPLAMPPQTETPQPETLQVELPDIPDVPEVDDIPLEIALVVGFEETATSGQVHVYYQPRENTEDNDEDDDELT